MDAEKREKIVQEEMKQSYFQKGTIGYSREEGMLERLALRVERETLEEAARVCEKKAQEYEATADDCAAGLRRMAGEVK